MLCGQVFDRFVAKCPVTVSDFVHLLSRAFNPEALDQLFVDTAQRDDIKELLFSTTVDLLATVVCRNSPGSVHAAYKDNEEQRGSASRCVRCTTNWRLPRPACPRPSSASEQASNSGRSGQAAPVGRPRLPTSRAI